MLILPQIALGGMVSAGGLPTQSIDFESSSSQYLSMSSANFGAYNRSLFAISMFFKRESTGSGSALFGRWGSGGNEFVVEFAGGGDKLQVQTASGGGTTFGLLRTTATYTNTSAFYHVLVHIDVANGTAGNRMRLWVDGTEVTTFDFDTNPPTTALDTTGGATTVGARNNPESYFDGLIYNLAFFSGSLPAVTDVRDSGTGAPKDVSSLTGLYAWLDVAGGSVVSDGVLAVNWTNNNTATASNDIPT